jgi:hypothetical protein
MMKMPIWAVILVEAPGAVGLARTVKVLQATASDVKLGFHGPGNHRNPQLGSCIYRGFWSPS